MSTTTYHILSLDQLFISYFEELGFAYYNFCKNNFEYLLNRYIYIR